MSRRNGPCHCGSGLKFKKCHGSPVALAQAPAELVEWKSDRSARFSHDTYYGPVMPMSEFLDGEPATTPDEIGPPLVSKLLDSVDAGDELPGPIFAGRASPVPIIADLVEAAALDRVRTRLRNGLTAKEKFDDLPIILFRGQTGGLMLECAGGASSEPVARAAIAWSVAVNDGNLCLWGGRLQNGRWLLGLTP